MKRILLVVMCFWVLPAAASHIVGGEFEVIHLQQSQYRVNLILYFDELNGNPFARDPNVTARIFRKRDNLFMTDVFLPLLDQTQVSYTQPECSKGEIVTSKLIYTNTINLSSDIYNDPLGYYIVWERCCRNYNITNIFSNDPQQPGAIYAGQTFYLEFPAVVKDGQPFINSTPQLFPPLNDYACPNRPYYVDFAGSDLDGDSLVYSLATPLNTKSSDALPFNGPRPRPYPDVSWRSPFSFDNILGGAPDLKISDDGFITVTPTVSGLFVFAVKCEEFRDGIKIGEVRRDFQMLVLTSCPVAEPPQIKGKKLSDADFTYDNSMSVTFSNTVADADRCIEVQVSDPDALKMDQNFNEKIKIKAVALGFKKDVSSILPDITEATLINGSTKDFRICFDACPLQYGPYQIGIVAYDDACSLPLSDTLKVTVNIQPPTNAQPVFTTPNVTALINEGDNVTWNIEAVDPDGDPLIVGLVPVGFIPQQAGMTFSIINQVDGKVNAQLVWDAKCDVYDFTKKTNFELWVVAEDIDDCNLTNPTIMKFNLSIKLPGNFKPIIDSDLTADSQERFVTGLTKKINDTFTFNVTGSDLDNDFIFLEGKGAGFSMSALGMSFDRVEGNGAITSQFNWNLACAKLDLTKQDVFNLQFVVVDNVNKCRFNNRDTLDVIVKVEPADNLPPILEVKSLVDIQPLVNSSLTSYLGDQIELGLYGTDFDNIPNKDHIRIDLIDARGTVPPTGYVFAPGEGDGFAETTFTWNPDCSIFMDDDFENDYQFTFRVFDDRCFNVKADTVVVDITIKDVESNLTTFLPPNIITPNGDHCNDYFAMEGIDPIASGECITQDPDGIVRLPKDNCIRKFEFIHIYNRWGNKVYESTQRDFRWDAKGEPNGVYYYTLHFTDKEYKGSLTVRF